MYTTGSHAYGGRTKRGKMVLAHFNPHELNALDHWQGKKETCPRTGMRSYSHLEELLKNPHIQNNLINAVAASHPTEPAHRARGGSLHDYHDARLNKMADQGVHGDTELALIGPHTRNVFDHLVKMTHHAAGNSVVNPITGHPHYGFLDGIIGGIGKVLSPIVSGIGKIPVVGDMLSGALSSFGGKAAAAAPGLLSGAASLASQYLPQLAQKYGGDTAGQLATMGTGFLNNQLQSRMSPEEQAQGRQMAQHMSNFGQGAMDSYNQGGIRGLAGHAMQGFGDMAGGQVGNYMNQAGRGMQQGQGFGDMARQIGGGAISQLGQQYLPQLAGYAQQFGQGLQQGQNPYGMIRGMMPQPIQNMMPQGYKKGGLVSYAR